VEAGKLVLAHEYWKHIGAIFSKGAAYGAHKGLNPTAIVKEPVQIRRKDERFITMEESARVQAQLPYWMQDHGIEVGKAREAFLLHYLLTLGMRASSAICFNATDLKESGGMWRYQVINVKTGKTMPVSQPIHEEFAKALKKLPFFSHKEKPLCDILNEAIPEILGRDVTAKHLRKGFITEIIASKEFSESDARRLTHHTSDVVENSYYALSQQAADAVGEYWNSRWFNVFEREYARAKWGDNPPISKLAQKAIEDFEALRQKP
jgi:integrase